MRLRRSLRRWGLPKLSADERVDADSVPFEGVLRIGPQGCLMVHLDTPTGDTADRWTVWPVDAEQVLSATSRATARGSMETPTPTRTASPAPATWWRWPIYRWEAVLVATSRARAATATHWSVVCSSSTRSGTLEVTPLAVGRQAPVDDPQRHAPAPGPANGSCGPTASYESNDVSAVAHRALVSSPDSRRGHRIAAWPDGSWRGCATGRHRNDRGAGASGDASSDQPLADRRRWPRRPTPPQEGVGRGSLDERPGSDPVRNMIGTDGARMLSALPVPVSGRLAARGRGWSVQRVFSCTIVGGQPSRCSAGWFTCRLRHHS